MPDALELEISTISHDGRGLGFLNSGSGKGLAIFVPGALPGQKILCTPTKKANSFLEASLERVIEESPLIQPPICPHWQICGGCPLQRLPYQFQLDLKRNILSSALKRIGHLPDAMLESTQIPIIPSPATREFRNKAEFAFGRDEAGNFALGFRKAMSHLVFNVEECATIKPEAVAIARTFREIVQHGGLPPYGDDSGYWRFLILRETSEGPDAWLAICLTSPGDGATRARTKRAGQELLKRQPGLRVFIHEERSKADFLAIAEKRLATLNRHGEEDPGAAIFQRELGGRSFQLDASSFFQVNAQASEKLAALAEAMAGEGENLLDIYSGVGAPGLLLARNFQAITCVESGSAAVKAAKANARNFNIKNYQILRGDAAKILKNLPPRQWSACLADPPRQGIGQNALASLLAAAPEKFIYISCNPATLARDASLLARHYQLEKIAGVDLFPHTPHLESISLWTKKDRQAKMPQRQLGMAPAARTRNQF